MPETYTTACPLNCWDACTLRVSVEQGRIVEVRPHDGNHITGNFLCRKGKQLAARANHPLRLQQPLLKKNGKWQPVSWDEALDIFAGRIAAAVERYGPLALLHYYDCGHGGILKEIESRFFSALGGCTLHSGSLCWAAGLAAQRYDFGEALAHDYRDILNSRLVLIWGRNPAATSPHLLPFLKEAHRRGTTLIVIDPLRTATAGLADMHLSPRPASDGALALAMGHVILNENLADMDFVSRYTAGFEKYRELAMSFSPKKAASITGLDEEAIIDLARRYARSKPAAILIGLGLQRHTNGGNTVRAIDALAALTGNIGVPGGGASYANFQATRYIDHAFLEGDDLKPLRRYYPKPRLGAALRELCDPPVQVIYVSRSNPLLQVGDSRAVAAAFSRVPFKVVCELFMTDTAAAADLVLPATYFWEAPDIYLTSMSHCYLVYGPQLVEAPGECRHEYHIFRDLAARLGLRGFPDLPLPDLLQRALHPLVAKKAMRLDMLPKGSLILPDCVEVPWRERIFMTDDGKYHFTAPEATTAGADPLPYYRPPGELSDRSLREQGYTCWLVSPHHAASIHSAHRLPGTANGRPYILLHPSTARQHGLRKGDWVKVSSPRGFLEAPAFPDKKIPPETVAVYQGWWQSTGAAANNLTADYLTDMGHQAALYDCLCRVEKI